MEEDISNYSPTVMFRGTPCNRTGQRRLLVRELIYLTETCLINHLPVTIPVTIGRTLINAQFYD